MHCFARALGIADLTVEQLNYQLSARFLTLLLANEVLRVTLTLGDSRDDTNGDGLTHVADGKAAKWRELLEGLDAHELLWHQDCVDSVASLGEGGVLLLGAGTLLL